MIGDVPAWAMLVWRWGMNAVRASCSNRGTFSIVFRPSYRNVLDFVKVPCNFWEKYTGTCLNMWNERAWHWATPVYICWDMYVSWSYGGERPVFFMAVLIFWADIRVKQTHARTHIQPLTWAHTFTRKHTITLWFSLSPSLSLSLSHTHTHTLSLNNPRPLCTLKWQCQFPTLFRHFGDLTDFRHFWC